MCRYWLSRVCVVFVLCSSAHADDALQELTPAVINKKYTDQISITVSGVAPFTYALGGEEKPAGLSIDPQTGLLHGVPTRAAIGTHRVHVILTDYAGKQTTQDFLLHVTAEAIPSATHAAAAVAPAAKASSAAANTPPPSQGNTNITGSPAITSATAGLKTVAVTSPAFPTGVASAAYKLSTLDAGKPCAAGNGNPLATAAGSSTAARKSDTTALQLTDPLKENGILCAEENFTDAQAKSVATTYAKPFTVTGSPAIAATTAGAKTVAVTSPAFPDSAVSATYQLYTIAAGKVCADGGASVAITDPNATASSPSTLALTDPLKENGILCAAETFKDSQSKLVATAYSSPVTVASAAAIGSPSIASAGAGVSTVSVTSPAFPSGVKSATYGVYTVDAGKPCNADGSKQLATVAGTSVDAKASAVTTLTLTQPLQENNILCAVETFKDDKDNTVVTKDSNPVTVTNLEANWGRVRAYFVGGLLITNDSSSFSSAHQFYALNVEKTWRLPHCYLRAAVGPGGEPACITEGSYSTLDLAGGSMHFNHPIRISGGSSKMGPPLEIDNATVTVTGEETIVTGTKGILLHPGQSFTVTRGTLTATSYSAGGGDTAPGQLDITKGQLAAAVADVPPASRLERWIEKPGVTSYFETRLTSIPVVSNATNTTCTPSSTTSGSGTSIARAAGATAGCSSTTTSSSNTTASFLTSQQTANVGVGVYLPFLLSRWLYKNTPNALFIAPIGKVGFNTITGATSQTVVLPGNGGTGTQSFDQIYNFYGYGARIGHMGLTDTTQEAPELYSYLDFSLGRFSNLESLICHQPFQRGTVVSGNGCVIYGSQYTLDSRKRLYRVDIEGLLKIPSTAFYVGLNANIGQKQVMAEKLDPNFAAPNDLRFLFGTKFDIAQLFQKLGVKQQ